MMNSEQDPEVLLIAIQATIKNNKNPYCCYYFFKYVADRTTEFYRLIYSSCCKTECPISVAS